MSKGSYPLITELYIGVPGACLTLGRLRLYHKRNGKNISLCKTFT